MSSASPSTPPPTLRLDADLAGVDASAWNTLLASQRHPTPFMRHEYLLALQRSGSAAADSGWAPCFLTLWRGKALAGAAALYVKSHSYGEYVFDWAWAEAYERHGLPYYPKLLGAVPFTPVPGTRLLSADDESRSLLLQAMERIAKDHQLSSIHLLFCDDDDLAAARRLGWMARSSIQFHWQNREPAYASFDDFLSSLHRTKRKKIQQERRRVAEESIRFSVHAGSAIDESAWDFFHRCYVQTYREHLSTPYLTREFFAEMSRHMPDHWLMFIAHRDGERIAASLVALDPERRVAYGRYWGALAHVPMLHFEACYYQPLAWCIDQGWRRFEGGAQGEHKMSRGLLPVRTHSAHWLAHPAFSNAVADFLSREGAGIDAYVDELRERSPFKPTPT